MKILLTLALSIVFSVQAVNTVYCNDTIGNEDQMIGVAAGKIWNQKRSFNIEQVHVNKGKIEVIIIEMTPKRETEIREIAKPFEVIFINQQRQGRDAYRISVNYILTEGKTDVPYKSEECGGLIFQLQNAPYVSGGFLMIPLKEVFTMLVGGNNQMIELATNSNAGLIQISCKNNTITIVPFDDTYDLEGKIEIRNGIAYFPCSKENLKYIVPIKITQDFEEMTVDIFS